MLLLAVESMSLSSHCSKRNPHLSRNHSSLSMDELNESSQTDYAFLQGSPSSMGLEHPASFMDPDGDIEDADFYDHSPYCRYSTLDHQVYKVIQKTSRHFFPEPQRKAFDPDHHKSLQEGLHETPKISSWIQALQIGNTECSSPFNGMHSRHTPSTT